jgi:hypothetical protein
MTSAAVPRIELSALALGSRLGKGGQGQVTEVSNILLNKQWPAVLKEYSPAVKRALHVTALETLTGFPATLAHQDGLWIHENSAWPAVVVQDKGAACGFLMRAVPPAFHFNFQTQTRGAQRKLADMAFLLNAEHYVRRSGIAVTDRDRLALLGNVASVLSRLHSHGVAVGDFSPKNVLFSFRPSIRCFLIDCDAVCLRGHTVLDQIETPDWETPAGEPRATPATDAYKFGLLAIRLFARDQSSRDIGALAAVAPELGRLAQLSQHPDPLGRPPLGTWFTALRAAASSAPAVTVTRAPAAPPPAAQQRTPVPGPGRSPAPDPPAVQVAPPSPARRGTGGCLLLVACVAAAAVATGLLISKAVNSSASNSSGSAEQASAIGHLCRTGTLPDTNGHIFATWTSPGVTPAGDGSTRIPADGAGNAACGGRSGSLRRTHQSHTVKVTIAGHGMRAVSVAKSSFEEPTKARTPDAPVIALTSVMPAQDNPARARSAHQQRQETRWPAAAEAMRPARPPVPAGSRPGRQHRASAAPRRPQAESRRLP